MLFVISLHFMACSNGIGTKDLPMEEISEYGKKQGNLHSLGMMAQGKDSLYFNIPNEGLYKSDYSGKNFTKISDKICLYLNVANDWIYYINGDDNQIYKMDLNGQMNQKISDFKARYLIIIDQKIYALSVSNQYENKLIEMDFSGKEKKVLIDEKVTNIYFYKNYIYYDKQDKDTNKTILCRYNYLNGDNDTLCEVALVNYLFVYEENIYYMEGANKLVKINPTSKETEIVIQKDNMQPSLVYAADNLCYFRSISERTFNLLNLDTEEIQVLGDDSYTGMYILNNKIFYYSYVNNEIYSMNLDGSNKALLTISK